MKRNFSLFIFLLSIIPVQGKQLSRLLPVYGLVKPKKISTNVAIGSGLVHTMKVKLGQQVKPGRVLLEILEQENLRAYKNTINGTVAKIHVTEGAAISPGMPLVTVVDPDNKRIEISLSPQDANRVKMNSQVSIMDSTTTVGGISFISSIVDPDNGAVLAYIDHPQINRRFGEVLSLQIHLGEEQCAEVVKLKDIGNFTGKYKVKFLTGTQACMIEK
jgi:multidrug efflux pump subunit AcrA (membrane-fusion protein)